MARINIHLFDSVSMLYGLYLTSTIENLSDNNAISARMNHITNGLS